MNKNAYPHLNSVSSTLKIELVEGNLLQLSLALTSSEMDAYDEFLTHVTLSNDW